MGIEADLGAARQWLFPTAYAASDGRLSAYPAHPSPQVPFSDSWFIYGLNQGQSKSDSLVIENTTAQNMPVHLYAVDATGTADGSFAMRNQNDPKVGVGSWIRLDQTAVTLKPRQRQQVGFTISVPPRTAIGDYLGGIIVQEDTPQASSRGNVQIQIIPRLGVRVYESVPGKATLSLKSSALQYAWKPQGLVLTVPLTNSGNVLIEANGTVSIRNAFSRTIATIPLNHAEIQPARTVSLTVPTGIKRPVANYYSVQANVRYEGRSLSDSLVVHGHTLAIQWSAIAAIVLAGYSLTLIARKLGQRSLKPKKSSQRRA